MDIKNINLNQIKEEVEVILNDSLEYLNEND